VEDLQDIFGGVVPFLSCIAHAPNNSLHEEESSTDQ